MPVTRISQSPINVSFLRYEREICTEINQRGKKSLPFIIWFVPNHTMGSCELEDPWMPPSLRRSPNLQGPEKTTHSNRGQRRVSTNISKKAGFCFRSSEWRPLLLELKAATGLHSTPKKQPSRNSAAPASWSTTSLATSLPVLEEALGGGGILNQQMAPGGRWGSGTAMVTSSVCRREGGK